MESPVNFDNLRAITGGDRETETELFRSFINSSLECLSAMCAACAVADEIAWKKEAHAFKGICFNLGAGPLSELCGKAQDDYRATTEEKENMLRALEQEFARVRQAVEMRN